MKRLDSLCTCLAKLKWVLPLALALTPLIVGQVMAQDSAPSAATEPSEEVQACMGCHDPEAESATAVHFAILQQSPHKDTDCTDCHSDFNTDGEPHTDAMLASKVDCSNCHSDAAEAFVASVHGGKPQKDGDLPTCISCHSQTAEDPHSVLAVGNRARSEKVGTCSSCHSDKEKMGRYGVDPEAVSSYEASFHGKALLRFGKETTAICSDCHTSHAVLTASDAKASTHPNQLPNTCGQAGCHPGAPMSFANSGFSHLHLTVKEEPILGLVEGFFKALTFGTLSLLLIGLALEIRVALFRSSNPRVAKSVSLFIGLGFASLIASIVLAVLNNPIGFYTTAASVGFGILGAIGHISTKRSSPAAVGIGKRYQRFTLSQRLQHMTLMLSFIALVVTGMPIRYPKNDVLQTIYMTLGGMDVMRTAHRVAAVALIAVWIYHTLELLVRWKKAGFSFDSWTMWPRKKDVADLVATFRHHLGLSPVGPSFDRFQFREKFDYFAVYWGMPIMVLSGLILWFPVYFSAYLPPLGIPLAYIAHADEAILAFLTIVTWHFYNTHFNPEHFPMNPVWLTGNLSESAMVREHPLELERLKAAETAVEVEPVDAPDAPTPSEPEVEPSEPDINPPADDK